MHKDKMRDRDLWSVNGKFFAIEDVRPTTVVNVVHAGESLIMHDYSLWKLDALIDYNNSNSTSNINNRNGDSFHNRIISCNSDQNQTSNIHNDQNNTADNDNPNINALRNKEPNNHNNTHNKNHFNCDNNTNNNKVKFNFNSIQSNKLKDKHTTSDVNCIKAGEEKNTNKIEREANISQNVTNSNEFGDENSVRARIHANDKPKTSDGSRLTNRFGSTDVTQGIVSQGQNIKKMVIRGNRENTEWDFNSQQIDEDIDEGKDKSKVLAPSRMEESRKNERMSNGTRSADCPEKNRSTLDDCDVQESGRIFQCGSVGKSLPRRKITLEKDKGQTPNFIRHKSVSSFANYASSRRSLRHNKKCLPTDSNEQDNELRKDGRVHEDEVAVREDNDDHAKSLPCLVNNNTNKIVKKVRPLSALSFQQHQQTCQHRNDCGELSEELFNQDNKCNEFDAAQNINENPWTIRGSSNNGNNRTTKLKRQNACRQKSSPTHRSLILGNSKNSQSSQFPHQERLHHPDVSGSLRLQLNESQVSQCYASLCRSNINLREPNNVCANTDNQLSEHLDENVNELSVPVRDDSKSFDIVDNAKNIDGIFTQREGNTSRGNAAVRSRSLNHLDTLEMRQGNAPVAGATEASASSAVPGGPQNVDVHLKDAKSEPDCSRPLLAPPEQLASMNVTPPSKSNTPSPTYRRHMLSRSQKSSSECFSVNFEVGDEATYDTELFFPAARGVTLHESLTKLCELRHIELSLCDVWLCDRESNVQTWLSLSQDTACLVGKHVKITDKDGRPSNKYSQLQHPHQLSQQQQQQQLKEPHQTQSHFSSHSRKLSGNFRPRTTSFFSSSTEEPSTGDFDSTKKQSKQRWSTNLFGNSKDNKQSMEQLIEHLNHYSRYGVPKSQSYTLTRSDSQEALNKLEDDWREIIDSSELNDKQQKQQTALWELIKTEVAYIKTLKVVTDLFLACLINLQASNILRDIDTNKLFSNITDILDANVQFWRKYLFPLVKDMRSYKKPPCLEMMCEGFLKLKDCFQAYYRFCGEQSRCQHYCRENLSHNELFTAYLAWCETQKECNRLRLMDILVQPMQRLTKYGLLLKAILRNSDDEVDIDNLNIMIRSVDDFVNNVNFSLKQKQDNERLKGIIARIESYDIVETKDDDLEKLVRNYNQLDLTKPMINCCPERRRHLLLEGDLKFKDSNTSKMEVHCFLLTDMLLVCKQSTKKGGATMRVIRQPYLIDKLVVTEINKETPTLACVYKNELDMAVGAFLLQNSDSKKLKSWKEGIAKAQTLYAQAKQTYLPAEESLDTEYSFEHSMENEFHCLQAPRSPLASSSRASRVSSLAHSHSGSVEMNDQSSLGSCKAISVENDNRTASISSDEGVQPLPAEQKSPSGGSSKNSFKTHRLFNKTPNTLSVQPTYAHQLGQSLPNLALGSPNTLSSNNTLSVPSTSKNGHLLSPTHRGISYPPPSPTRGNLRRGMAINQSKNPPLIKTRHVVSSASTVGGGDFDVPVIAGVSSEDTGEFGDFFRGHHRQAMKRAHRSDNRRYHTAGTVDDLKKEDADMELIASTSGIQKHSSWNCSSSQSQDTNPTSNEENT